ncbi:MAG: hypothetical protein AAB375_02295 [Patescibacteria group bacterium]
MDRRDIFKKHATLFEPTPLELSELEKDEPRVSFTVLPPDGISEGRQSRVSILEYTEQNTTRQVLFKRMGAGKQLSLDTAKSLESRLIPYRDELARFGWRIPTAYYTRTLLHEGEGQIFSYEQRVGRGDGEKIFGNPEQPNFLRWNIIRQTFETLARYPQSSLKRRQLAGQGVTALPHGLDLKLANVVPDIDGTLYFVDLFGPKEIDEQGRWRTYRPELDSLPKENLLAVCASREGTILRFWRLAETIWSKTLKVGIEDIRRGFLEFLDSLNLPSEESDFIKQQIATGYPWLDRIYSEQRV